jgi:carbonic anhydrase/acetyltransferase-like protein (isoleucine patch superfamily)
MALIIPCREHTPIFGNDCFLAENATIVGEVTMGDQCSVWWQAVVRGDVNFIRIGDKVNIQDGAIIHGTYQKCGTTIGNEVSIGHRAMVHGCTIHDRVLVGMGAIVMDEAVIEEHCLIAAGAVVLEKTICHAGGVYAGVPAKRVKELSPELFKDQIERIANNYLFYSGWFK